MVVNAGPMFGVNLRRIVPQSDRYTPPAKSDCTHTSTSMESPEKKRSQLRNPENAGYFRSYSDITIHEEMLYDRIRTSTYRLAILRNYERIRGKVVMDIGAGTGILSMFCVHAGAKKVYAIEASEMTAQARKVIAANKMEDRIEVIHSMVEDADLPEKVDVIVSEWMGYFLVYETMLPSVIFARDHWLKKGGLILPDQASLFLAPFSGTEEQQARHEFWEKDVLRQYKVDLSSLVPYADACHSARVHVRCLPMECVVAHAARITHIDLNTITAEQLIKVKGEYNFKCFGHGQVHGFVSWFKVTFPKGVELKTSPYDPSTHWEQSLVYLDSPLDVKQDTRIVGSISLTQNANMKRYLDIAFEYSVDGGSTIKKECLMNDFVT